MSDGHRSSRVDEDAFQADAEGVSGEGGLSAASMLVERKVCSTDPQHQRAINDFLVFSRNVLGVGSRAWDLESVRAVPLEEDELAIEYLSRYEYDLPTAKFSLLAELGAGQGTQRLLMKLVFSDNLLCLDAANVRREVHRQRREGLRFDDVKAPLFQQSRGLLGAMHSSAAAETIEATASERAADSDLTAVDPSAQRKRWVAVTKRVHSLAQRSGRTSDRPTLQEAQAALEEAASLPDPRSFLSEDTVPSYESSLNGLLEKLLAAREWVGEVRDLIGSLGTATPQQLKGLLAEADALPVTAAAEEAHLRRLLREADNLRAEALSALREEAKAGDKVGLDSAEAIVQRSQLLRLNVDAVGRLRNVCEEARALSLRALAVLERSRSLRLSKRVKLEMLPLPLDNVEKLLAECEACSLVVPFAGELRLLVESVQRWRAEVHQMMQDSSRVVSLQRLEQLLGEAEGFPVDLSDELAALRDKREVAKGWLEKLKKVLPNKGRQPIRRMDSDDYSESRVNLNDVKALVANSELVLHRESEEERTSREIAQSSRELNKAQTLVDVAEGWAARVRDLLGDSDESSVEALEELLREAESMPVYMEEMALLRVHLDTCAWSKRVRRKLEAGKPRPADLQRFVKDLAKIRSSLPNKEALAQLVSFPEEAICNEALAASERWMARSKRLVPGGKRDIDFAKLYQLYKDGVEAPVNLESELRPLHQWITDAELWVDQHRAILSEVGIQLTLGLTEGSAEEPMVVQESSGEGVGRVIKAETSEGEVGHALTNMASLPDLERLFESASHLVVVFPELQELRSRIEAVHRWLHEANSLYPRKIQNSGKKRAKSRRTDEAYLDELLARGRALGVDISSDLDRVSEIVEYSKQYNATCTQSLSLIGSKIGALEQLCLREALSNYAVFPFLEGVKVSGIESDTHRELAAALNAVQSEVNDLVRSGEDSVLSSAEAMRVDLCAGLIKWVVDCRAFLLRKDWVGISAEEIACIRRDVTSVLTPSW